MFILIASLLMHSQGFSKAEEPLVISGTFGSYSCYAEKIKDCEAAVIEDMDKVLLDGYNNRVAGSCVPDGKICELHTSKGGLLGKTSRITFDCKPTSPCRPLNFTTNAINNPPPTCDSGFRVVYAKIDTVVWRKGFKNKRPISPVEGVHYDVVNKPAPVSCFPEKPISKGKNFNKILIKDELNSK